MVETAHADQIRERGGLHGIRDAGLLESALARPQHRWSHDREAEIIALAACYGFGRTKNHALLDGNKRIGFVAMNMFLILNGYEIDAPESEAVDAMLRVAGGLLDEAALTDWLGGVVVRMSG